jgi:membrane protein
MIASVRHRLLSIADFGRRCLGRFVELEGFDRAMALAGQAFAALLPLLIVIASVSPTSGDDLSDTLSRRFKLSAGAENALHQAVAQPPDPGLGALGVFLLVVSALSFTRAMQRLYVRAWRLGPLGLRGNLWGLEWLAIFVVFWSLQPVIASLSSGVVAFALGLGFSTALWLVTPYFLVAKRIAWRRLVPQALLTAIALDALTIAGAIYLPRAFESASQEFGVLGVAFTLLSLLFSIALCLVGAAAIGATIADAGDDVVVLGPADRITRDG